MNQEKRNLRIASVVMAIVAFAWGGEVVRQSLQTDDGGPPLGAMCMAIPAFALIVGAGIVWSSSNRSECRGGVDVTAEMKADAKKAPAGDNP